jgi:hypothetical protein
MTFASSLPTHFGISVVSHRRFKDMFACKITIPFEGVFWLVDGKRRLLDVFKTREAAMAAGAKALLPIINHRIVVPEAGWKHPPGLDEGLARHGEEGIEFGFFEAQRL